MKKNQHTIWAKRIKRKYPQYTKTISVEEIQKAWEEYSDKYCASWLLDNEVSVREVMDKIRYDRPNYPMADSFFSIFGLKRVEREWVGNKNKNMQAVVFADDNETVFIYNKKKKDKNEPFITMSFNRFKNEIGNWMMIMDKGKRI